MDERLKQAPRVITLPAGVKFLGIWKITDLTGLPVQLLTRPLKPGEALEEYTVLSADLGLEPEFTPKLVIREQAAESDTVPETDKVPDSFLVCGTEEDNL